MSLRSAWNCWVGNIKQRIEIEGEFPERALLRLKREGISVYNAKKTQKNRILLSVKSKDTEKAFAIFQNVCYNRTGGIPYSARKKGLLGLGGSLYRLKNRVGVCLGALLFCAVTAFADGFVFGIRFTGNEAYAREACATLARYGIKPFALYKSGNEDLIAATLLSIPDMEFCSVQKRGLWAVVEMRLSPKTSAPMIKGNMRAAHTGTIVAFTTLSGTPTKKVGDSVRTGDTLVEGYILSENGKQTTVAPVARVSIACVYEAVHTVKSEEEAFAAAYLEIGEGVTQIKTLIIPTQTGYGVRIEYTAVESINF